MPHKIRHDQSGVHRIDGDLGSLLLPNVNDGRRSLFCYIYEGLPLNFMIATFRRLESSLACKMLASFDCPYASLSKYLH